MGFYNVLLEINVFVGIGFSKRIKKKVMMMVKKK